MTPQNFWFAATLITLSMSPCLLALELLQYAAIPWFKQNRFALAVRSSHLYRLTLAASTSVLSSAILWLMAGGDARKAVEIAVDTPLWLLTPTLTATAITLFGIVGSALQQDADTTITQAIEKTPNRSGSAESETSLLRPNRKLLMYAACTFALRLPAIPGSACLLSLTAAASSEDTLLELATFLFVASSLPFEAIVLLPLLLWLEPGQICSRIIDATAKLAYLYALCAGSHLLAGSTLTHNQSTMACLALVGSSWICGPYAVWAFRLAKEVDKQQSKVSTERRVRRSHS